MSGPASRSAPELAGVRVERAAPDAAPTLAELHLRHFRADDHLAMAFGPAFVRAIYRWFVTTPDAFVLVARDAASGAPLGFTSVADRPYTVPMLRACWRPALAALLRRPALLFHPELRARLGALLRPRRGAAAGPDLAGVGQVAFTLVVPEARGRGVGGRLKEASLELARARGLRGLLTGIRADNEASQRMNLRAGFVEVPELRRGAMRSYLLRFEPERAGGVPAASPPAGGGEPRT